MRLRITLLCAVLSIAINPLACADEGMWPLNQLPLAALKKSYDFVPDQAWIDHVMRASARLDDGCSGSFVSARGLVITNAHCVLSCAQGLSDGRDYVNRGFVARRSSDELRCPSMELDRLEQISDVSARIASAVAGKSGQAYVDARRAEQARIESACAAGDAQSLRCDVVELYQGGLYHLYRYRRFQDVRLVLMPEYQAAFFGGDPDNFNFPRYDFDVGLLRAYEHGVPAVVSDYFRVNPAGPAAGELTLVSGHPGSTERQLSVVQLETLRDFSLLDKLLYYSERRAMLAQYSRSSDAAAHYAQADLMYSENAVKVFRGELQALLDPQLLARKRSEEAGLRASAPSSAPWDEIARAEARYRQLAVAYQMLEEGRAFYSQYFDFARGLLRAAQERAKPDAQRLPEYQDAALPALQAQLLSSVSLRPQFEQAKLVWSLLKLREALGPDDPVLPQILGRESPQALAARLVAATQLGNLRERRRLWEGGIKAISASQDPFLQLARAVDAPARELRRQFETEVAAPEARASGQIARLRFARDGTRAYPDATFTLRLSYGTVQGWDDNGKAVPPFTNLQGAYARQTGFDPFLLPPSWNAARDRLDLATSFNYVTSNDIVGGNSGSPLLNRKAEIVGLAFDGNMASLGGAYAYDGRVNRAVAVHPAAIIEVLDKIYQAPLLSAELLGKD